MSKRFLAYARRRARRKRTEIVIEVDEVICATSPGNRLNCCWCSVCGGNALMVTPQQAATIARVSVRTVNRGVESGQLHFRETPAGMLWVCVNSLSKQFEKELGV